jgi:NAD+ diphosphatase
LSSEDRLKLRIDGNKQIWQRPVISAATHLYRRAEKRGDAAWVQGRLQEPQTRILPLVDLKLPVISSADRSRATLRWVSFEEAPSPALLAYLGDDAEGAAYFAAAYPLHDRGAALLQEAFKPLVDLRSLAVQGVLPHEQLLLAAQARFLAAWHGVNGCCARCGASTVVADAGWRRRCGACGQEHYPRNDPAVIMLITRPGFCLLGHENRFPDKFYSALAGFVEPGDDIEHTVRREVKEEAGIDVGEVRYIASQSWPFPHQLMIGCWGEALSQQIAIDTTELEDVRWFSKSEALDMLHFKHAEGLFVPPSISMAHTLIRGFVDGLVG